MSTAARKLRVDHPADSRQGGDNPSNDTLQPVPQPVALSSAPPAVNDAATEATATADAPPSRALGLSAETTERLRQILRTESLTTEAQLIELTKHALALQYLRGQNDSAPGGGKDSARQPSRSPSKSRRVDSWEQHRRAQRKAKIRNVFGTMVLLFLAATGTMAISMFRPALSGASVRAPGIGR